MVTFADIAAPTSVARMDPNDLAASFGEGVRLKALTLEITREGVTESVVDALLPWLSDPRYMKNPGWGSLPLNVRKAVLGLKPF